MRPRLSREELMVWAALVAALVAIGGGAAYVALTSAGDPGTAEPASEVPAADEDDDEARGDDEDDDEEHEEEEEEDESHGVEDREDEDAGDDSDERRTTEVSEQAIRSSRVLAVAATVETDPVRHSGDAADDPAIWIHPVDRSRSTVIATDKQGGLVVYDLAGRQLQYVADGEPNNVDVRPDFSLGGRSVALAVASDRAANRIAVYRIDLRTRMLVGVGARKVTAGVDVYGICLYRSKPSGKLYAVLTSESGTLEQWELFESSARVDARRVRTLNVGSQSEGCVADDERGLLYVAEEQRGIWRYGAEPSSGDRRRLLDGTGKRLFADVEGLAIAATGPRTGYLVASSQGNDTFVVYRREGDNTYVRTFRVGSSSEVDAAEDTDGIEVTTASLGRRYRGGLFVAQDGQNDDGLQNFKLVPWRAIDAGIR